MKEVDLDQVLANLPDLASLKPVASSGPFAGRVYELNWNGRWRTNHGGQDFAIQGISRDDVDLTSEVGKLTLRRPTVTRHQFPSDEVEGLALSIHLQTGHRPDAADRTFRTYVRADPQNCSHLFFPDSIKYSGARRGGGARALLPLRDESFDIDIYFVGEGPYVIFESSRVELTIASFRRLSGAARQLFSYLTGEPCDRDSCDMVLQSGRLMEAWWYQGRTTERHRNLSTRMRQVWSEFSESLRRRSAPVLVG